MESINKNIMIEFHFVLPEELAGKLQLVCTSIGKGIADAFQFVNKHAGEDRCASFYADFQGGNSPK